MKKQVTLFFFLAFLVATVFMGDDVGSANGLILENKDMSVKFLYGAKGAEGVDDSVTINGIAVRKITKETKEGSGYICYAPQLCLDPGLYELCFSYKGSSFSAHVDLEAKGDESLRQKTRHSTMFSPVEALTATKWTFKIENAGKYALSFPIHCHENPGEVWLGDFKLRKIAPPKVEWRYEYSSGKIENAGGGDPDRNKLSDGVIGSGVEDGLVMISKGNDLSIEITFPKAQWVEKVIVWTSRVWPAITVNSISLEGFLGTEDWQELSRNSGYKADDWGLCKNILTAGGAYDKLNLNFKTTGILGISEIEIVGKKSVAR